MTAVKCATCGKMVQKYPSQVRERNFCCNGCRLTWFGKWTADCLNVPGHSAGHKAPHLTRLNQLRNPASSLHSNGTSVDKRVYRRIVEKAIGRELSSGEDVHHINGNRADNRLENLRVMSRSEHHQLHMQVAVERYKGGD